MKNILFLTFLLVSLAIGGCASMGEGSVDDKRQILLDMEREVLSELYRTKPDTRAQLGTAPGYAVFSNANINLLFFAAGTGYGLVNDKVTGKTTYMNMAEGGVGLGFGVKDYRIVMVFHSADAINDFVTNGWTFGGNADASAKASGKGGSVEGEAYYGDVTVYTFTENGLALQAMVKGTKFWVDKELN
ncbi:lipid-binding SYLF domain-containing protein [Psychrosphaera aestuarii]|uniref:lipid-binding SYLF domain-containing protein n=1 Tax=Psychrosphaera aestuarii TaxID=1266052 RepID=UPI001B33C2CB|nr:YSC84-related protein [Psychrosphaera aestuarii]